MAYVVLSSSGDVGSEPVALSGTPRRSEDEAFTILHLPLELLSRILCFLDVMRCALDVRLRCIKYAFGMRVCAFLSCRDRERV